LDDAYVFADLRLCLVQFGLAAPSNKHVGAFVYEAFRRGQSDSAGSACNDGNLVVSFPMHCPSCCGTIKTTVLNVCKAIPTEDHVVHI
jgi:hypothetical protein